MVVADIVEEVGKVVVMGTAELALYFGKLVLGRKSTYLLRNCGFYVSWEDEKGMLELGKQVLGKTKTVTAVHV